MSLKTLKASYTGKLTPAQAAHGINATIANVNRLAEDAILLFEAERYPSAASLAILAIEEYGKISVLKEIVRAEKDCEIKELWKCYRTHTKKNVTGILPGLLAQNEDFDKAIAQTFDKNSDHPELIDHIKQLGFYTYCMDNENWSCPSNRIDRKIAENYVGIANFFSNATKVTPEEIEVWSNHFKGVSYEDANSFKKALFEYHIELQSRGISSEKLDTFLNYIKKLYFTENNGTREEKR
jgi:AbiV family abortive infection protein